MTKEEWLPTEAELLFLSSSSYFCPLFPNRRRFDRRRQQPAALRPSRSAAFVDFPSGVDVPFGRKDSNEAVFRSNGRMEAEASSSTISEGAEASSSAFSDDAAKLGRRAEKTEVEEATLDADMDDEGKLDADRDRKLYLLIGVGLGTAVLGKAESVPACRLPSLRGFFR